MKVDLAVERMKLYSNIKPVLTDAQRTRFSEMELHFDGLGLIARIGTD